MGKNIKGDSRVKEIKVKGKDQVLEDASQDAVPAEEVVVEPEVYLWVYMNQNNRVEYVSNAYINKNDAIKGAPNNIKATLVKISLASIANQIS